MKSSEITQLSGSITHITYCDEESHFMVAKLQVDNNPTPVCIVGTMPAVQLGEILHCTGEWKKHTKHGMQFEVLKYEIELPKDPVSIEKFLSSGTIRGIGPAFASRIVRLFGAHTLDVIDQFPDRLDEVPGLTKKKQETLITSWKEHKTLQEVVIFLHGYGITLTMARKILRTYGCQALQKIKQNPYQLAKDVTGIGFLLADKIAKNLGFEHTFSKRIQAGIDFSLYELAQEGHVAYPLTPFVTRCASILEVEPTLVSQEFDSMLEQRVIEIKKTSNNELFIWSRTLYLCERKIAAEIIRLLYSPSRVRQILVEKAITWAEQKLCIHFAPEQKTALRQAFENKVSIITGGPGTGKSTITKALVGVFSQLTKKILLAAPTGKAAKRLTEITTMYASTIHRVLKFDFIERKFKHNRDNPIDADIIIIDESSMIDTYLMSQLLQAIHANTRLIIIGDSNQLPSVGPGTVLRDLIQSHVVPVTELRDIFRQAKGSHIIVNAHRINEGKMPLTQIVRNSDFLFIEIKEPVQVTEKIIDLVTKSLPERYGFDAKKDIQVLAPMKKGVCGIDIINQHLQNIFTPRTTTTSFTYLRQGDKVMQVKNNYKKEVFNGDIGYIEHIDETEKQVYVHIDERRVVYDVYELDDLILAYAVSVHKYQGSECPCIIMPVHTTHFKMLTRNLLYTGVTRAKKLMIVVGTKQALAISVRNKEVDERYTNLADALCEEHVRVVEKQRDS